MIEFDPDEIITLVLPEIQKIRESALFFKNQNTYDFELKDKNQFLKSLYFVLDILDVRNGSDLTVSERKIAQAICDGRQNSDIANELFISEKTVKFHATKIYKKLGVRSRGQLIAEFYKKENEKLRRDLTNLQGKPGVLSESGH